MLSFLSRSRNSASFGRFTRHAVTFSCAGWRAHLRLPLTAVCTPTVVRLSQKTERPIQAQIDAPLITAAETRKQRASRRSSYPREEVARAFACFYLGVHLMNSPGHARLAGDSGRDDDDIRAVQRRGHLLGSLVPGHLRPRKMGQDTIHNGAANSSYTISVSRQEFQFCVRQINIIPYSCL